MFLFYFILGADWAAILPLPAPCIVHSTHVFEISRWRSGGGTEAPPAFSSWRRISYYQEGCQMTYCYGYNFVNVFYFVVFIILMVEGEGEDVWILYRVSCKVSWYAPPPSSFSNFSRFLPPTPTVVFVTANSWCVPPSHLLSDFNRLLPPPFPNSIV